MKSRIISFHHVSPNRQSSIVNRQSNLAAFYFLAVFLVDGAVVPLVLFIRAALRTLGEVVAVLCLLREAPENHLARGGLKHRCHLSCDGFADHPARVVDHYHGAIIQIGHALVVLFPFFQDENLHRLPWQDYGLERVGQLINIEHIDSPKLRHFIEVEVVGDDLRPELLCQFDQLQIDLLHIGIILLHYLNRDPGHLFDLVQDIQTAPAAVSLDGIRAVGDLLQLAQHEMGNGQRSFQEACLAYIRHSAVNNDAGVEYLVRFLRVPIAENPAQGREVEIFCLISPANQPHIGHQYQNHDLGEGVCSRIEGHASDDHTDQARAHDAENGTDGGTDDGLQRAQADADLYENDQQSEGAAKEQRRKEVEAKRPDEVAADYSSGE